jgi:FkbM family methyltransferase
MGGGDRERVQRVRTLLRRFRTSSYIDAMPLLHPLVESLLKITGQVAPTDRGAYRLARLARRLRPRTRWHDVFLLPDGRRLELDMGTYPDCCMALGWYEKPMERLIRRMLPAGAHFVDGGAYAGYFTTLAGRLVGAGGRVDAFEPVPETFSRLAGNVERNQMGDRVRLHHAALLDVAGQVPIHQGHQREAGPAAASLFARGGNTTLVPAVRMDQVLAGTAPTLIKLDVEGSEAAAIRGMTGLLQHDWPPAILMEYNPRALVAAGEDPPAVPARLLQIQPRYQLYIVERRLRPISLDDPRLTDPAGFNLLAKAECPPCCPTTGEAAHGHPGHSRSG